MIYDDRIPVAETIKPTRERLSRWRVQAGYIGLGGFPNRERAEGFAEGWNRAREVATDAMREIAGTTASDMFFGILRQPGLDGLKAEFGAACEADIEHLRIAGLKILGAKLVMLVVLANGANLRVISQERIIDAERTYAPFTWEPEPIEPSALMTIDNSVMFEIGARPAIYHLVEETWGYLQFRDWLLDAALHEKVMTGKASPCVDCG